MLGQAAHLLPVLRSPGFDGEHVLDHGDSSLAAERAVEVEAQFPESLCQLVVAGEIRHSAIDPERLRVQLRSDRSGPPEQPTEVAPAFVGGGRVPEALERNGDLQAELGVVLRRPVESSAEVVTFRQTDANVRRRIVLVVEVCSTGDRKHLLGMTPSHRLGLARFIEPLCELADGLEHPVARFAEATGAAAKEALVEQ
ncbi:MAG: hypothetical protein H0U00_01305 [Actinobacteria bacterium]|nr:hypothetical protein [Actinomycetota bacterium]